MKKDYLRDGLLIVSIIIVTLIVTFSNKPKQVNDCTIKKDSVDLSQLELTKENFEFVCHFYEIDSPKIVYAQAQLESAHFTSNVYKTNNNFLGLYNTRTKSYYYFNHWSECLKGYKDFVQVKWDQECSYYDFLANLPYAEDPGYINKLKRLTK